MTVLCNPLNIAYKYPFNKNRDGSFSVNREAADPSVVLFQGSTFCSPR